MSMARPLSIILVGQTIQGSRTVQRAAALTRLGHQVQVVPINLSGSTYEDRPGVLTRLRYRLRLPADPAGANQMLLATATTATDLVWIEAAPMITATTLHQLRLLAPHALQIWYAEDDMMNPVHRSRQLERAIPYFDWWLTTKSFNTRPEEVPRFGVRRPLFVNNSFDPTIHRPVSLSPTEQQNLGADITFVGTFEAPRAASMLALAEAGFHVRVWGNGWGRLMGHHPGLRIENRPVYDTDYAKVVAASKISLGFLRKGNRDLQTCRTVEIPACGGFMLHEYSDEAAALAEPDREAGYFSDDRDLLVQCRRWLDDDDARQQVAINAAHAMLERGHSHDARLRDILRGLLEENQPS